jgi:hypothetical protein
VSFLFPWAIWFGALVPVIVGFYMLRQRRRRVVVPSVLRWRASPVPAPSRMALGRVHGWSSLLLNLLIFALILLALARPDFSSLWRPEPTVIVLDARLRMSARGTDGVTAFERARAAAAEIAGRAGDRNPVAILSTSGLVSPLTPDARRAGDVLNRAQPSDGGGGVDATITLAKNTLEGQPGRVVFVTDRPVPLEGVDVVAVGESLENVAVTDFSTRALPDGGQSRAVFVRVRNFSTSATSRDLEIRIDDRLLDVVRITLEPGGSFETVRSFAAAELESEQGQLTGTLVGADAISADDVGRAAVPVGDKPRVLLVSAGNWFLENALRSDPEIAFELLTPGVFRDGMESSFDAVVFDDFVPAGMTRAAAAAGNFLFVGASPWSRDSGRVIANPVITDVERDSPLLARLSLDGVTITEGRAVVGLAPVASSVDDALIAVRENGMTRTAVFGFRVEDSDLPLRVAFPLLIANTVHWLAGVAEPLAARAGEMVIAADGGLVGEFDLAGFYAGGDGRWLAVNPAGGESDVRGAAIGGGEGRSFGQLGLVPWKWLVVAAIALLSFEWVAWSRRWVR